MHIPIQCCYELVGYEYVDHQYGAVGDSTRPGVDMMSEKHDTTPSLREVCVPKEDEDGYLKPVSTILRNESKHEQDEDGYLVPASTASGVTLNVSNGSEESESSDYEPIVVQCQ